jgi:hypothetical protein
MVKDSFLVDGVDKVMAVYKDVDLILYKQICADICAAYVRGYKEGMGDGK